MKLSLLEKTRETNFLCSSPSFHRSTSLALQSGCFPGPQEVFIPKKYLSPHALTLFTKEIEHFFHNW